MEQMVDVARFWVEFILPQLFTHNCFAPAANFYSATNATRKPGRIWPAGKPHQCSIGSKSLPISQGGRSEIPF